MMPAVTLSVAKRKGTNAVLIVDRVLAKVNAVRAGLIPADVHVTVTRNYGETASEKSNELLKHLLLATRLGDRPHRALPGAPRLPASCWWRSR